MPARDPFTTGGGRPFVPDEWGRRYAFRVELDVPVIVFAIDHGDIRPCGPWNLHDASWSGGTLEHVGDDVEPGSTLLVRIDHTVGGRRFVVSPRARVVDVVPGPTRTRYDVEWRAMTDAQTDALQRLALAVTRSRLRAISDGRPI
jgi:hypothetical protein